MPILEEQLVHPVDAVQAVTGKRLNYATVYRWMERGLLTPDGRRARLEYVKAGAGRLSSAPAVRRLIAAQTGGPAPSTAARTNRQRDAALARAEAECAELGI